MGREDWSTSDRRAGIHMHGLPAATESCGGKFSAEMSIPEVRPGPLPRSEKRPVTLDDVLRGNTKWQDKNH